eukprot:EG_transcript_12592
MTVEGGPSTAPTEPAPPLPLRGMRQGRSPPLLNVDIPREQSEVAAAAPREPSAIIVTQPRSDGAPRERSEGVARERSDLPTPPGNLLPLPSPRPVALAEADFSHKYMVAGDETRRSQRPAPMVISPPVSLVAPRPVQVPPPAHARMYHALPVVEYITPEAGGSARPTPRYLRGYREGPIDPLPLPSRSALPPESNYVTSYEPSYMRPATYNWGGLTSILPGTSYGEARYQTATVPAPWPASAGQYPTVAASGTPAPAAATWTSAAAVAGGVRYEVNPQLASYTGPELKIAYLQGVAATPGPSATSALPGDGVRSRRALSWHPGGASWDLLQPRQYTTERTVIGEPWVQTRSYIKEPSYEELYRGPPSSATPTPFPVPQPVEDGLYRTPPSARAPAPPAWPQPPPRPAAVPEPSYASQPRLSASRVIEEPPSPANYRRVRSLS